ncbi:MAG TPA: hypothetical protein VHE83_10190 [Mycobacteriales bacterium]|nr:hypothetical protein [Mycobacteriales bacterium]
MSAPRPATPVLTVCTVVTTEGAPVERWVQALRDQLVTPRDLEVVIVDATPDGGLRGLDLTGLPDARVVRGKPDAPRAELLDLAWRTGTARGVGFLSAEDVPSPGWTEVVARSLARGRRVITGAWLPISDDASGFGAGSFRIWATEHEVPIMAADNLACLRADLEAVGGFGGASSVGAITDDGGITDDRMTDDERDTRLVARLVDAGVDPLWVPAYVLHDVDPTLSARDMLAARARVRPALRVLADHPRARARLLLGGLIWNRRHAFTLLLLVGLALARRDRRLLILLGAPWVHERTCKTPRAGGPRRRWAVLPGVLLFDVYDAVTTLVARLRPRA